MSRPRMSFVGYSITGALFMLLATTLGAQVTGVISGTVRDDSGAALPGVTVSLAGDAITASPTRLTGADGSYRFTAVPPGTYDLSFRLEGFAPEQRSGVPVADGGTVIVIATLKAAKRYTLALTVDSGSTSVITNEATVTTSTKEGKPGDESAAEDTTITTRADLTITASDSVDPVIAGTALTYTVAVANKGPSDARFVEVSDTLPTGVTFNSTSGCAEDPGGVATCTLGTIPAGGSKRYTITATVSAAVTGSINNQASVSSQTMEAGPGDESTSENTAVDTRADLSITTSESADPVIAGHPLTYAVTVSNGGPSDAREVVVSGTLPEGAAFDSTTGCAEDPGGIPTCTLGTVPASGSKQFTVALAVDSQTTAGLAIQMSSSSQTTEVNPGDEATTESTAVDARADLVLTTKDSVDPIIAGTPLAYTVTVRNDGPSDARDVVVSGTLPAEVTFGSTSGCAEDPDGAGACTLGSIPAGGSKQYSIATTVDSGTTGALSYRASVSAQTTDASPGDETATEDTAVDTRADLVLTNRDSVDPVVAGLPLTYTVTVANNGPSDARDVVSGGSLPAGVTFRSTSGCAEDGGPGGGVAACTLGTIVAGSSKQYTISVLVNPDATGVITNQANVSSSTTEDRPGDESAGRASAGRASAGRPPAGRSVPTLAPLTAAEADPAPELAAMAWAWAQAWSGQRIDAYLAFYAADFRPPEGISRSQWEALRRSRVMEPQRIVVALSGIETELLGSGRARVSFDQVYRSDTFDDTVRKTLELALEDGRWKILEERVE